MALRRVSEKVSRLAHLGIAYITLAHLIYRDVATDAPAMPFLSDRSTAAVFPQPATGLTDIGRAAVRAMVKDGVLVDVAHMSERSRRRDVRVARQASTRVASPVLASHAGYRFGTQEYTMPPERDRQDQGARRRHRPHLRPSTSSMTASSA